MKLINLLFLFLCVSCQESFMGSQTAADGSAVVPGQIIDGVAGGVTAGIEPGVTGGGEGGSTEGGSAAGTSGGSTEGGAGGGVDGGEGGEGADVQENFTQVSGTKKLDILWVLDNSGSMDDNQTILANNFSAFIGPFIDRNVDFKMAVSSADHKLIGELSAADAKASKVNFVSAFTAMINVGSTGAGEQGLGSMKTFLQNHGGAFLRPDAYLVVIILSDEVDGSAGEPDEYVTFVKGLKPLPGLVKVNSIIDPDQRGKNLYSSYPSHERYPRVSQETAGSVVDIRTDFASKLLTMSSNVMDLLHCFPLANTPVAGSLKVYVNGVLVTGYTYKPASRTVKFSAGAIPPAGASIKIVYKK